MLMGMGERMNIDVDVDVDDWRKLEVMILGEIRLMEVEYRGWVDLLVEVLAKVMLDWD